MLPKEFLERMRVQLGDDFESFAAAMESEPVTSIKLNRRKCSDLSDLGYGELEPVTWCPNGYYLDKRPNFTLNPLLHAGVFYVQEASSMWYESHVGWLVKQGFIHERSMALDLCAAPGGKTTSIINALPDGAFVVANEFVPKRAAVLKENLLKWGYPDVMVTNSPTSRFACSGMKFDLVAVDAPCSGEGMMRKDPTAVSQWSPKLVEECAALQREILSDAVSVLRPSGYLLYSTCTFSEAENEKNVEWLQREHGLHLLSTRRFLPHNKRGEGLYYAVLQKLGDLELFPVDKKRNLELIRRNTNVILDGIPRSVQKGKLELPTSEGVLATDWKRGSLPEVDLDRDTALHYLRHEAIVLPENSPRGFVVVTYKGYPLGLVKNIGNRANNLFPSGWRIRMDLK